MEEKGKESLQQNGAPSISNGIQNGVPIPNQEASLKSEHVRVTKEAFKKNLQEEPVELTATEKNWAMLSHMSAFLGIFIPFFNIIAPLIIWFMKKGDSPFIYEHSKEALNFNISVTLYAILGWILSIILIGFLVLGVVGIGWFILTIVAGTKASKGVKYRYPYTIRLIN